MVFVVEAVGGCGSAGEGSLGLLWRRGRGRAGVCAAHFDIGVYVLLGGWLGWFL